MLKKIIPAISVIIPMYNTEKYVGECLQSLLCQTFQDYEVIVVDDCSTDNSVAIIESMKDKFDGRLKLIRLRKNSGGAGTPRNIGMQISRGKYISFLDSDDMFVNEAMEKLFKIAEKTNADVVHMNKYFVPQKGSLTELEVQKMHGDFPTKIVSESKNVDDRVKNLIDLKLSWGIYSLFVRRDLIFNNDIKFINILAAEDFLFSFSCLCSSKNYVNTPDVLYIYRTREGSITNSGFALDVIINKWIKGLCLGIKELDRFMNEQEFFKKNISFKYMVIDFFFRHHIKWFTSWAYAKFPYATIDNLVRQELDKIDLDKSFVAHYFNMANIYFLNFNAVKKENEQLKQRIIELEKH